jgi:hypothetical protein
MAAIVTCCGFQRNSFRVYLSQCILLVTVYTTCHSVYYSLFGIHVSGENNEALICITDFVLKSIWISFHKKGRSTRNHLQSKFYPLTESRFGPRSNIANGPTTSTNWCVKRQTHVATCCSWITMSVWSVPQWRKLQFVAWRLLLRLSFKFNWNNLRKT